MIDDKQAYEDFCGAFQTERIPLGYDARDMKPVAIPFQQLYCMSFYFGNPKGTRPVFRNLLTAAQHNGMEVIVVRRETDSVFDETSAGHARLLESTAEGLTALSNTLRSEHLARIVHRDAYNDQHEIPRPRKDRVKKAAKYIRAHSRPILVVIERFEDFCAVNEVSGDTELRGSFEFLFSGFRWYNVYFAAGFYPNDEAVATHPLMSKYNQDEFILLSGGRYDKAVIRNIPYQLKKIEGADPAYNQFLVKYQDAFHPLIMPCGEMQEDVIDPDEAPIL